MRKISIISIICIALFSVFSANATIHTVTAQNEPLHFLPLTVNAVVGDTVRWVYVAGNHIVGPINSSYIPAGAAMWVGTIDDSHYSYDYILTVAGTYHYDCHPATPHGEDAYIVVTGTTGVDEAARLNLSQIFPNPFSEIVSVTSTDAERIIIFNSLGKEVKSILPYIGQTKTDISVSELSNGIYFCCIFKQGILPERIKLVKN